MVIFVFYYDGYSLVNCVIIFLMCDYILQYYVFYYKFYYDQKYIIFVYCSIISVQQSGQNIQNFKNIFK